MLSDYRVIDLSNENGIFCGYLLAQLGAEVIAIEPPGGSMARQIPPIADQQGLWWEAYSRGKTCVELDLETDAGRAALVELVQGADFVIDSFMPQQSRSMGLTYEDLSTVNPALIQVSITPFGQTGPKADWPATDLTVWAASGAQILSGDDDLAPVRTSVPQAFLHAGADAAGAALIALQARHKSGLGQHVDISAQRSSAQAALSAHLGPANGSELLVQRYAGGLNGALPIRMTWPCANGYVAITLLFGPAFKEPNKRLMQWIAESGHLSAEDAEEPWDEKIMAMMVGGAEPAPYFDLCDKIEAFTLERTREALFEEGLAKGVYIAPTFDIGSLLEEKHFHSRDYWQEILINGSSARVPGAFAKFSASPLAATGAATRLPGAETRVPRATSVSGDPDELPLAGLKVLDFMWVIAGPLFTRVLQDYGATVIRIESSVRMDPVRASPPFKGDDMNISNGMPYNNFNAGKMGITIDPSNPVGKEVILDLVKWADVVTESFSPKAMKAWGLDYDSLKAVNPDIIMMSSCLMGQTGDRALVPGYGNMAAAITGFYELTGWPQRSPAGPYLAYTDGVSPRFMLAALMGALEHKRKTGQGQSIDVSQAEAAIHLLAPAILDFELTGRTWSRDGNRDIALCPHGVFPVLGDDKWIAIACQDEASWQRLVEIMGLDAFSDLTTAARRRTREDDIEAAITAWTAKREIADIENSLIAAGIAAHRVQGAVDSMADPQFTHSDHFITVPHTNLGDMTIENNRFRFSRTPAQVKRAGPDIGEHNVEVLMEILGYDGDRMADVFASLAME